MEITGPEISWALEAYRRPVHTNLLPPSTDQSPPLAPAKDTAPAKKQRPRKNGQTHLNKTVAEAKVIQ